MTEGNTMKKMMIAMAGETPNHFIDADEVEFHDFDGGNASLRLLVGGELVAAYRWSAIVGYSVLPDAHEEREAE